MGPVRRDKLGDEISRTGLNVMVSSEDGDHDDRYWFAHSPRFESTTDRIIGYDEVAYALL